MPKYWMITDRNIAANGFGERVASLSYWKADSDEVDPGAGQQVSAGIGRGG